MHSIPELFGSMVFNDAAMKEYLPRDVYAQLRETISTGAQLNRDIADVVAGAMKDWAVAKGATHYTHWFQPMTGVTAEKHNSFITPVGDGKIIMEFSGRELIRGESDASSFPSGGLRATFEARGYTVWDTTSFAFIKDDTLCVPTAFCSYSGEALDMKTPLLRSMDAIEKQALRVLRFFGNESVSKVSTYVGAEQEYFLVDKAVYLRRPDLLYTGRTLFGASPPKGQELGDHFYGSINQRVSAYMKELDTELWKLGVTAKTRHNETAPAQHEFVPVFTTTNIATDHNQLTMELMKSIAGKHGLACLLHEKPFAGINGSGKHNNWSINTDTGANLLEPGKTPYENAQFLLFLVAVIRAVDEYQDLLRASVASAGNDHRLVGANEAPPAIVSIYLGEELTGLLEAIESGSEYRDKEALQMEIGATVLPRFPRDTTDRNRTSPIAFSGNRFEIRMVGSASSIGGPNTILNTAVAEVLSRFADVLEKSADFRTDLAAIIKKTISDHKRIIYNGNNYAGQWELEAARRGLSKLDTTVDALPSLISDKSVRLFERHGVFSGTELLSRYEVLMDNYCKSINIEALTVMEMIKGGVIPACVEYQNELAKLLSVKKSLGGFEGALQGFDTALERRLLDKISVLCADLLEKLDNLEDAMSNIREDLPVFEKAAYYRDVVRGAMNQARPVVDKLESLTGKKRWPFPSYAELLYSVV